MPTVEHRHERRFYLEQFHDQLLVIGDPTTSEDEAGTAVDAVVDELITNGAFVVRVRVANGADAVELDDARLVALWGELDSDGMAAIGAADADTARDLAATVAARLRANKLVLLSQSVTRADTGGRIDESYISIDVTETHSGAVELAARALRAGVASVNVVHIAGLSDELLTYRGAGTLYTAGDYVTVEPVGFGDFGQVRRLIKAGVEDGFLKPRTEAEIRQLVVNGYGARVERNHVAGFAALLTEPYVEDAVGEIAALSTISRFAGGGVGSRLIDRLVGVAADRGLDAVFATTTSADAAAFFERCGFATVANDDVPSNKWRDYDAQRRAAAISLKRSLRDPGST